jgi:electron transfer flavoprotein alpha subunit
VTVFCLVELDGGAADGGQAAVADVSLRAVTMARELARAAGGSGPGGRIAAVVFGGGPAAGGADAAAGPGLVADLGSYGVTDVYTVAGIDGYAPLAWAGVLQWLISEHSGHALVAAGTERGNEVLAHLGAIAGLPMAANCTAAVDNGAGEYAIVRQRWAGLLLEEAELNAPVALLTVATDAVAAVPAESAAPVTVHQVSASADGRGLAVRAVETPAGPGGASLATARVVVGGGRGVGGADGFGPLEELAALLGGVVGVSRVVTSEGWRPHTMQVGQTGTKITPDLYLACGISGAIQHFAGCSGAKTIIAVNTDPAAPMMTRADYAVVGDLHQIIPALVAALRDRAAPDN